MKERGFYLEGKVYQLERLVETQQLRLMEYSKSMELAKQQKAAFTEVQLIQNQRLDLSEKVNQEWEKHFKREKKQKGLWKILAGIGGVTTLTLLVSKWKAVGKAGFYWRCI